MNLKSIFLATLQNLGVDRHVADQEWDYLLSVYVHNRHLKNIQYLKSVLSHLNPYFDKMDNPDAVKLSIFYHSIIYTPENVRNYQASAELFNSRYQDVLNTFTRLTVIKTIEQINKTEYDDEFLNKGTFDLMVDSINLSSIGWDEESINDINERFFKEYSKYYPENIVLKYKNEKIEKFSNNSIFKTNEFIKFGEVLNNILVTK